jgi:glyoxylase-like metal-dependent hydrolase (beta-lactamase superfamily II)
MKRAMKANLFKSGIVLPVSLALAFTVFAYGQQNRNANDGDPHILPVRGNIYMLVGAGANVTLSVGSDGILLVDTGSAQMTDKILATIRQLANAINSMPIPATTCVGPHCIGTSNPYGWSSPAINAIISAPAPPKPIRFIINTSMDPDHTGGNEKIAKSGKTFTGGNVTGTIGDSGEGADIIAHENVLLRMSGAAGKPATAPEAALPRDTYHLPSYKLSHFFNGEGVQIFNQPAAHTDGDSIVYFRFSDVISAGDILMTTTYPVIDLEKGGSIQGIIDGLNRILDMSISEFRSQGGTMIIPGHGRLCDTGDVANYRNMVTIIRDRIQAMIKEGMTPQQVKAARPTRDYDGRWGSTTGPWTTDMFVDAAYRSLSKKQ